MRNEFCKKHNVDHTGTFCGHCVVRWQINARKLANARKAFKKVKSWICVYRLPKNHPLRSLNKALR
jgi:hypothetical protein